VGRPRRKAGGRPENINAVRRLEYVRDIEQRVDGRSLLGQGLRHHQRQLLDLLGARTLGDLDALEIEAVRRLVKRRVVRELAWGRVQDAIEEAAELSRGEGETDRFRADGLLGKIFDYDVPRFQDAVDREEKTEARLETLIEKPVPPSVRSDLSGYPGRARASGRR
jgi:hypothetical protein